MIYRAVDNETFLIKRHRPFPRVVCTSSYEGSGEPLLLRQSPYLWEWWRAMLENDDITIIGMNIAYDMATSAASEPSLLPLIFEKYEKGLVTDIAVRQKLWDIATGRVLADDTVKQYSLKDLAELVIDKRMVGKDGTGWRLRFGELVDLPLAEWPEDAASYAKGDAKDTWDIWDEQNKGQDLIKNEFVLTYSEFCFSLITAHGMRTDPDKVAACKARFEAERDSYVKELLECGLLAQDKKGKITKKKKAAQERIENACAERGIDVPKTKGGKKGQQQTATDAVACFLSGDELMAKRAKYSTAEKMLSTYIPTLEEGTKGVITSRFGWAATMRTTSSTPRPPLVGNNFQNAPRYGGIRECYRPREGCVYLVADINGAELHTLAQFCFDKFGYSALGDMLNDGIDVHLKVGSLLLGIDYDDALLLYKEGDEAAVKARQDAKAANFGFPGGMMYRTFIKTQIKQAQRLWSYEDTKVLRNAWLEALPEMDEFFAYCKAEAGDGALIEVNRTGMLRFVRGYTVATNTQFQAPTAAGALAGNRALARECYVGDGVLRGCRVVNFVHDENVLEVPVAGRDLHDTAMEVDRIMSKEFNVYCPDFPTNTEPVLSSVWSKKAKQVFDEHGRLTVWHTED